MLTDYNLLYLIIFIPTIRDGFCMHDIIENDQRSPYDHKNKKQMKFSIFASEKYFATRSFTLARGKCYNAFLLSKRPK